jgi:hypothetical protein
MLDPDIPVLIAAARARAARIANWPPNDCDQRSDAALLLALAERLERVASLYATALERPGRVM